MVLLSVTKVLVEFHRQRITKNWAELQQENIKLNTLNNKLKLELLTILSRDNILIKHKHQKIRGISL